MTKMAANSRERVRYFAPFEENGLLYCGGQRRKCMKCKHLFLGSEKFLLECPICGTDRRCRIRVQSKHKCQKHARRHLLRKGPLHPHFAGGYLASLAKAGEDMAKRYELAYKSLDMRSVRDELAMVQTRANMLTERLKSNITSNAWIDLQKYVHEIELLMPRVQARDPAAVQRQGQLLGDIFASIREGATDSANWQEVLSLSELSANLKGKEASMERDRKAYMTPQEAMQCATLFAMTFRDAINLIFDRVSTLSAALSQESLGQLARSIAVDVGCEPVEIEKGLLKWKQTLPEDSVAKAFPESRTLVSKLVQPIVANVGG